jgi:hypothetical protein
MLAWIASGFSSFDVCGSSSSAKSGVWGEYLVRVIWFPSRFPLEGTGRNKIFGP